MSIPGKPLPEKYRHTTTAEMRQSLLVFHEVAMTKTLTAILALALGLAVPALAQNTNQPTQVNPNAGQQPDQNQTQPMTAPDVTQPGQTPSEQSPNSAVSGSNAPAQLSGQTLSGTISADGKTFNSNGTSHTISNPNSVKPFAGQPVTVEYEADTNNSMHITKVMMSKPQQ
jgi:hypothetical protein